MRIHHRPKRWLVLIAVLSCGNAIIIGRSATSDQAVDSRGAPPRVAADLVLRGGTLIDGTGAPGSAADVAILSDRIAAVGSFQTDPNTKTIDVSGLIVAPGFIDLHTHSDSGITQAATRLNVNYLTQGVTTIVTGNCGGGVLDVIKYLAAIDAHGAGTNVIHLVP